MSLTSAINSAISGLNAQSTALALVSNNLANTSTTGYKTTSASFSTLLAGSTGLGSVAASGGVRATAVSDVGAQGLLTSSTVSTNMAISGNGFFAVAASTDDNSVYYTRNGEFSVDSSGYLVNNGYYLLGWPTESDGSVVGNTTANGLEPIDVDKVATIAAATTTMSMVANLPADAEVGATFTSSVELYDSLGTAATSTITWTKTAANEWVASFSDPSLASNSGSTIGTVTSGDIVVSFNENGTLAGTNPSPPSLTIANWTTGAATGTITLDMGNAGSATGLSQYASGSDRLTIDLVTDQDGVAMGSLIGVAIGDDGTVSGVYDNGMTRAIYRIPVATFTNADGLSAMSGGIYQATTASGGATLRIAGTNGAGTIHGSQLELSTADTNTEFAKMMAAQQAYSGAAQIVSTAKSMFDTLISAVR
jgi:flagellar hook protein FlgE